MKIDDMLIKTILGQWKQLGIVIDKFDSDYKSYIKLYMSVPATSDEISVSGEQVAGKYLARVAKRTLSNLVSDVDIDVKYKIRDEHWNLTIE